MYTRSYPDKEGGIYIPESYGGTALRESERDLHNEPQTPANQEGEEKNETIDTPVFSLKEDGLLRGVLKKLPFVSVFGDLFENGKFGLQSLGTEEILIIAAAAFLFFSKEGDKECAIMLILLLFIA